MWGDVPIEAVKNEWSAGIEKFKLSEIGKAIEHCAVNNKFPPTLPEFIQLCKANQKSEFTHKLQYKLSDEELAINQQRIQEAADKLKHNPPRDYRKWARDIIADHKKGLKVNDTALRFANEAMAL